jgi:hypothetical protein
MLPLAIVLALTPPAPHSQSLAPPALVARRLQPPCPDIDRGFVRYVAPPEGHGPVWPVNSLDPRYLDFGPAVKARGLQAPPPPTCPRLLGVGDR